MAGEHMDGVGVVVSTLGRSPTLEKLFASIRAQTVPATQVVVVDQSDGETVQLLAKKYEFIHMRTPRGLSLGRNSGLAALDACDVVAFPDDDCEYARETFAQLLSLFRETGANALCGRLDSGGHQRIAFTERREELTKKSVWKRSIEPATFYTKSILDSVGAFDEELGIGSATKWQSGEGTDLLIRVLNHGGRVVYDPTITVTEHPLPVNAEDYLRKVRAYARGTGKVYAKWYSLGDRLLLLAKPLIAALVSLLRGRKYEASQKWQAALGRFEGMT